MGLCFGRCSSCRLVSSILDPKGWVKCATGYSRKYWVPSEGTRPCLWCFVWSSLRSSCWDATQPYWLQDMWNNGDFELCGNSEMLRSNSKILHECGKWQARLQGSQTAQVTLLFLSFHLLFLTRRNLYPLLDFATEDFFADSRYCFHPHLDSFCPVLPQCIPLQSHLITAIFSLREILLFEIFASI